MSKTNVSSNKPCLYCQISGPASSRIRDEVPTGCFKNRKGNCVGCQKLLKIEQKIEETRRTLVNLFKEKEALASTLNEHHDPLSRRVPVEITSRIFLQSIFAPPVRSYYHDYEETPFIKSVFLPGHISKYWREVARGTPQLWSTLCLTIKRSNCVSSVLFVREWLELSGGIPLAMRLSLLDAVDDVVSAVSEKIITSSIEHAHRWKVLNLAVPGHLLSWIANAMPNQHLDCLEEVTLNPTGNELDATSTLSLQATPCRLVLGKVRLSQISLNTERLTHFDAHFSIEVDECIELFQVAPCLLVCNLLWDVTGDASSDVMVNSPSLHTLNITEFPGNWWNNFTFPSLEKLTVDHCEPSDESWMPLHALLQRSGCKLKEFTIRDVRPNPDMMEVLKLTPSLRQLHLYGDVIMEPFFSMMDATASSTPGFLQNLSSLACDIGEEYFDWTWLLVFLTTMTTRPVRSLRSFIFTYMEHLGNESKPSTLRNKKTFKFLLDVLKDVEFKLLDCEETDLVKYLRSYYNV